MMRQRVEASLVAGGRQYQVERCGKPLRHISRALGRDKPHQVRADIIPLNERRVDHRRRDFHAH